MFVNIKYIRCFSRRAFARLVSLCVFCFVDIAAGIVGMFYCKRSVSRGSSCPHGAPPLAKAAANKRLAQLGRYDSDI